MNAEESLNIVLQRVLSGNLYDKIKDDDKLEKEHSRIYGCLMSIRGILFNSILDIPEIALTIDRDQQAQKNLVSSIINIVNNSQSGSDLKTLLDNLDIEGIDGKNDLAKDYGKILLQALEGD